MGKVKVLGVNPFMMNQKYTRKVALDLIKGVEFPCEAVIVSHDADTPDKRIFRLPNGKEANSLWLKIQD